MGLCLVATPCSLFAAQLFMKQSRIQLRTIHRWEQSSGLELMGANAPFSFFGEDGYTEASFLPEDACGGLAYRVLGPERDQPSIPLDHLCPETDGEELNFLLISDTQALHGAHRKVAGFLGDLMKRKPYALIINGGDLVNRSTEHQWQLYHDISSSYASTTPLVPILGNHEFYQDPSARYYEEVYGFSAQPDYFSFLLKGVVFVILDSNFKRRDDAYLAAQLTWLEQTLAEHAHRHLIIVGYHHPAYSSGMSTLAMPYESRYIRQNWLPLFRRFGVDLIVNGHDHIYERLQYEGLQAVIAGAAGGYLGLPGIRSQYSQVRRLGKRTVTAIQIHGLDLALLTYDAYTGKVIDTYTYQGDVR